MIQLFPPLEPDPYKPSNPITKSEKKWNPISKIQNVSDDEDSDSEEEIIESFVTRNNIEDLVGEQNVIEEREDETFHPGLDRETEEESQGNLASSSEDLSDGQLEDMVDDLHNLHS